MIDAKGEWTDQIAASWQPKQIPTTGGRSATYEVNYFWSPPPGTVIRVSVADDLPEVTGNKMALGQAVENLITNGLKFIPEDRVPKVRIEAQTIGKLVRLWIIDNGIGIPEEHHSRIFRVFERLHTAESFPGTGIGLAIVRKGVERMNGRVGLESEVGKGSRFWIELPAATAPVPAG